MVNFYFVAFIYDYIFSVSLCFHMRPRPLISFQEIASAYASKFHSDFTAEAEAFMHQQLSIFIDANIYRRKLLYLRIFILPMRNKFLISPHYAFSVKA
jgi:hypothetical protein